MLHHSRASWNLNIMLRSWVIMATENSYDCVRRGTVSKVLCVERSLNGYLGVLLPFCYPREQRRLSPLEGRRWTSLCWYDSSWDPGGHHFPSVPLWNGAWRQGHLQMRWVCKLATWTGTRQDDAAPAIVALLLIFPHRAGLRREPCAALHFHRPSGYSWVSRCQWVMSPAHTPVLFMFSYLFISSHSHFPLSTI